MYVNVCFNILIKRVPVRSFGKSKRRDYRRYQQTDSQVQQVCERSEKFNIGKESINISTYITVNNNEIINSFT